MVSVCSRFKSYITGQNSVVVVVFFFSSTFCELFTTLGMLFSQSNAVQFTTFLFLLLFSNENQSIWKNILSAFFNFLLYDDRHANLVLLFAFQNSLTVIKEAKM